ncbi:hypothetical protein BGZ65_007982 [Modicella reniformis]|uniref:Uncharacterized protein n=1 Tax=Modicella reniformis TaxID=1440133 RepID=A0A9P6IK34_9FUNG|nr:hypothetical protein BGZ65_007982 [Modicella reniformis]
MKAVTAGRHNRKLHNRTSGTSARDDWANGLQAFVEDERLPFEVVGTSEALLEISKADACQETAQHMKRDLSQRSNNERTKRRAISPDPSRTIDTTSSSSSAIDTTSSSSSAITITPSSSSVITITPRSSGAIAIIPSLSSAIGITPNPPHNEHLNQPGFLVLGEQSRFIHGTQSSLTLGIYCEEYEEWSNQYEMTESPDFNDQANNFKSATSHRTLGDDLWNSFPAIEEGTSLQREYKYIWNVLSSVLTLWEAGVTFKPLANMEGWFTTFLYGPLLAIMFEVDNVQLLMTEKQGLAIRNVSQDAVFRIPQTLDLLVAEFKSISQYRSRKNDLEKLGNVLRENLLLARTHYPQVDDENLRMYGVYMGGVEVILMEARFVNTIITTYRVAEFNLPKDMRDVELLVRALLKFVSFKKRIEDTLNRFLASVPSV